MATEPSPQNAERRASFSRPAVTVMVGWLFVWPVVIFACAPYLMGADAIYFFLLGAGTLVWFGSVYGIYDTLFTMAEARWPVATTIRKTLNFLVSMVRAFHGHHSS
jgi:hypothetical protein